MSDIEFVDELPNNRAPNQRVQWDVITEKLKADPGHWAKVGVYSNSNNTSTATRAMKWRGVEAVTRRIGPDEVAVFARWPKAAQ